MTITNENDLIDAFNRPQRLQWVKTSGGNKVAGQLASFWRVGTVPAQPAVPGAATACTDATAGSPGVLIETSGRTIYLAELSGLTNGSSNCAGVWVYDRLAHMGGLNGTLATAQTVDLALPARAPSDGAGVEWFLEWYTDTGGTAVTATIGYTNQAGTPGQTTTVAVGATTRADRLLPILPAAADSSIQSIQTVTLSATTGSAGNFGVTAGIREQTLPLPISNTPAAKDSFALCLPEIHPDACLWLVAPFAGTAAATLTIEAVLVRG